MNTLTKIQMANLVVSEDKKVIIKNTLCKFYGATDVTYKEMPSGILIEVSGTDSFRFIKDAIIKTLEVKENALSILNENKKTLSASYIFLPEKDQSLGKKLNKMLK